MSNLNYDHNSPALPALTESGNVVKSTAADGADAEREFDCDISNIGNDIVAILTTPRLIWADMMQCAQSVLFSLGITMFWNQGVFWGQIMTRMLEGATKGSAKYALVLDYDSVFNRDDILKLYAIMQSMPEVDALCPMQLRRGDGALLATVNDIDGNEALIVNREVFNLVTVPIATGNFGCTLIKTSAISSMSKPLFKSIPNALGNWENGKIDEDIWFWKNMRESGLSIHMAPSVHIGHCELVVTWADNRVNPVYQPINDYNVRGKPANAFGSDVKIELVSSEDKTINEMERI